MFLLIAAYMTIWPVLIVIALVITGVLSILIRALIDSIRVAHRALWERADNRQYRARW